jgi:hypothetical protein
MVLLGVVCALPVWLFLGIFVGGALLGNVGARAGPEHEFAPSVGAAAFFAAVTLLAIAGLIIQARARLNFLTRSFLVAFLVTSLGLFAVCDLFSISS